MSQPPFKQPYPQAPAPKPEGQQSATDSPSREQKIQELRAALALDAANPRLWAKLMHHLWAADEPHLALATWRQTERDLPEPLRPYLVLGNVQRDLNAFEEAALAYARETELGDEARRIAVAWNHSQILIGLEDYSQAFALAERRFELIHQQAWRPPPYWLGWPPQTLAPGRPQPPTPGAVTLWSEQGFGDCLQYLRWVPQLIQMGWTVRLEVEPPLLPLLREGLAWLGPRLWVAPKGIGPLPLASPCQGSLLSLPWLLGGAPLAQAFAQGPADCTRLSGYLRSPHWPRPADRRHRQPRIGLVWAAGSKHDDDFIQREYERRSLPATALIQLLEGLERSGAELVCLQFGRDRQRAAGWGGSFAATLSDGVSLADNARWISALDLVITVDTATAHLVGAMAKPGWVLLPWGSDPRWLRHRQDSPWYPSLTLLRQPQHRDWDGLVQLVLERFQRWQAEQFAGGAREVSP